MLVDNRSLGAPLCPRMCDPSQGSLPNSDCDPTGALPPLCISCRQRCCPPPEPPPEDSNLALPLFLFVGGLMFGWPSLSGMIKDLNNFNEGCTGQQGAA